MDLNDYGPENWRDNGCFMVVTNNFIKFGWTVTLRSKIARFITNSFEVIILPEKQKPKLSKTDDEKKFENYVRTNFLKTHGIKKCSREISKEAFLQKHLIEQLEIFLRSLFMQKIDSNWTFYLLSKAYKKTIYSTIEATPVKVPLKHELILIKEINNTGVTSTPMVQLGDFVRTAD